jgi:hypothetical protein
MAWRRKCTRMMKRGIARMRRRRRRVDFEGLAGEVGEVIGSAIGGDLKGRVRKSIIWGLGGGGMK